MSKGWTAAQITDQTGRRAVVTGATSGLGFQTALELARHGAHVVLAVRDPARGTEAAETIAAEVRVPPPRCACWTSPTSPPSVSSPARSLVRSISWSTTRA